MNVSEWNRGQTTDAYYYKREEGETKISVYYNFTIANCCSVYTMLIIWY